MMSGAPGSPSKLRYCIKVGKDDLGHAYTTHSAIKIGPWWGVDNLLEEGLKTQHVSRRSLLVLAVVSRDEVGHSKRLLSGGERGVTVLPVVPVHSTNVSASSEYANRSGI